MFVMLKLSGGVFNCTFMEIAVCTLLAVSTTAHAVQGII